jgi:8-oxo-dGTP pyrophosphatase MutT (NUDIX family)
MYRLQSQFCRFCCKKEALNGLNGLNLLWLMVSVSVSEPKSGRQLKENPVDVEFDLSLPASGASIKHVIENIRGVLTKRQILHVSESKMKVAAVLVPIFLNAGRYHLLFIQRTERVKDHKGQIAFPGGTYNNADGLLLNTALREAEEEIGLAQGDVEVLGELDDTIVPTNYVISPFVGLIPYPYDFKLDKWEVEELIEIPLEALLNKNCYIKGTIKWRGHEMDRVFCKYGNKIIWGATCEILKQFVEIVT